MSDLLEGLNREQRDVVLHRSHCLTIACPGSGKTKTLATKAAHLLNAGEKVAAVTFTRDAALELRERIIKIAKPGCKPRLLVGTFHSIDMLMAFPKKSGDFGRAILADAKSPFTKPWNIVKEGVRRNYIVRALRDAGMKLTVDEASTIIEHLKSNPTALDIEDDHRAMVESYVNLMTESGHIDFQDIILNTNAALRNKTLDTLKVDHLMIDEYQDTDKAQLEWTMHHGRAGVPITVVGDDDQSIYAFRNALGFAGMDLFAKEFNAMRVLLGTNYRCRAEILAVAEKLIQRNTERIDKVLYAHKGKGGYVSHEAFKSENDEIEAVCVDAENALADNCSFAVIARTNRQLVGIEASMVTRGIPFIKTDGKSIFDYAEIQVTAAALRTTINPKPNDVDMVLGWAGMSVEDTKGIRRAFGNNIVIGSPKDFKNLNVSEKGVEIWRSFAAVQGVNALNTQNGKASLAVEGMLEWLSNHLVKPNSPVMLDVAHKMFKPPTGQSLEDHLAYLRSQELKNRDSAKAGAEDEVPQNRILLTTAHSSKGLEFDRVWIIGMNTGVFPSDKSSIEEERRLMFVAMTRAREILFISSLSEIKPSLFLYDCGLI